MQTTQNHAPKVRGFMSEFLKRLITVPVLRKTPQIRGVKERKQEAYVYYGDCLSDVDDKVAEVFNQNRLDSYQDWDHHRCLICTLKQET